MKYDVLKISIDNLTVELIAEDKSLETAEAIENMCVMRHGVESHIFTSAPAGKYKTGDKFK